MLRWLRQNRLVFIDDGDKWRKLLKEVYAELDTIRRERNALKKEVARLQAICECQAELLGGQND
ncbi:hypothetical protein [Streptococcus suis]